LIPWQASILDFFNASQFASLALGHDVDSVWEPEKLEARKMLENTAESPASSSRFVGQLFTFTTTQ